MLKPMKDNGTIRFYDEVNFVYYELGINNEPINIGDTKKRPALRKCVAGDASIRRILICRTYADKSPYEGHHKNQNRNRFHLRRYARNALLTATTL